MGLLWSSGCRCRHAHLQKDIPSVKVLDTLRQIFCNKTIESAAEVSRHHLWLHLTKFSPCSAQHSDTWANSPSAASSGYSAPPACSTSLNHQLQSKTVQLEEAWGSLERQLNGSSLKSLERAARIMLRSVRNFKFVWVPTQAYLKSAGNCWTVVFDWTSEFPFHELPPLTFRPLQSWPAVHEAKGLW